MAQHTLSLEAPDTLNKCIIRIVDTSIYDPNTTISCPLLQITPPGFNQAVNFSDSDIQPAFNLNLTACDLGLQKVQCGTVFNDLPDGIYIIKYSVQPKNIVYVEYNHLRITKALWKLQALYCDLDLATCAPDTDKKNKMDQLRDIESYLKTAKAKVEFCHEPQKGMELYNYAIKLLDKMNCKSCH
jgi:hypothetical protein